ncbi:MAG: 4-(cytidine 5'-diphospho)-2-C-methyl-D-erythritol kinase [Caulobacteraceae bacterium]|nr:4-(cytidine 5'-diphospho)-2-C-methyl-D-erythritol kinase [Caulobacteraceae bacterium]
MTAAFAPAKVNLYLHVGAPGADGFHPLCSLAAFARDVGDAVRIEPARAFGFTVDGPFAGEVGDPQANLAVRVVRALAAHAGAGLPPLRVHLDKRLPVAAGLGGGTSDAASALRLVRDAAFPRVDEAALYALMAELASDGPMCLRAQAVVAQGRGEQLSPPPAFPDLPAVLVNPGVPCPTPTIFRAYDALGRFGGAEPGELAGPYESAEDFAEALCWCRNDLEAPARAHHPSVSEALAALAADPRVLLSRLSGSGATSFALCAGAAEAAGLAADLAAAHPDWWVRCCILGGSRP